ncbi:MAG: methyl-accepting chemotaxis protein [Lachnospiraceae bacterium]|nr:methyl-accepting chemotaxis protein [Lachnospiraceae bacterium]
MERKKKVSILFKLVIMVLAPCLLMGVVMTLYSRQNMKSGMKDESVKGLKAAAYSMQEAYWNIDSGNFTKDENGDVYKGETKLSGDYTIVDRVKKNTGVDITLFYNDTRIVTSLKNKESGERLIGTKASEEIIKSVLNGGKEYSDTNVEINGNEYYGYYVPMRNEDNSIAGMIFAGRERETAETYIKRKTNSNAIVALVILVVACVSAGFTSTSLTNGVREIQGVIGKLARGNLRISVTDKVLERNDEIGEMADSVNELKVKLFEIIGNIKKSSEVLHSSGDSLSEMAVRTSTTTDEMNKVIGDISNGAVSQAEEIEEASQHIGEMGIVIEEIVSSVDGLGNTSQQMKSASDESTVIIQQLSESNDRTTKAIERISEQIYATNNSAQLIHEAIELITSIAGQTNLLALNASIEAARAGEHGKGFVVVATEIQQLAEQSNASAEKIKDVIKDLLNESEQTVKVMKEVERTVSEQQQKLEETKEKFDSVTEGVDASREETTAIQDRTEICNSSRAKVIDVIGNLSAISQENAASTEQTTASMNELNETIHLLANSANNLKNLSEELERNMSFFQL